VAWKLLILLIKSNFNKEEAVMFNLKNLIDNFDRMMAAITFAEAGEPERAMDILYDRPKQEKDKRIESGITRREETRPGLRM